MARDEKMVRIREVQLESDPTSGRVVILKEGGGARRHLTMVVGDSEFAAIAKRKDSWRQEGPSPISCIWTSLKNWKLSFFGLRSLI